VNKNKVDVNVSQGWNNWCAIFWLKMSGLVLHSCASRWFHSMSTLGWHFSGGDALLTGWIVVWCCTQGYPPAQQPVTYTYEELQMMQQPQRFPVVGTQITAVYFIDFWHFLKIISLLTSYVVCLITHFFIFVVLV